MNVLDVNPHVIVTKNRTNVLKIRLGIDVSGDTFASQIRSEPKVTGTLIATWDVVFETNGVDGVLIATIDNSQLTNVAFRNGYMDLKRVSNGEPLPGFKDFVRVVFKDPVTE